MIGFAGTQLEREVYDAISERDAALELVQMQQREIDRTTASIEILTKKSHTQLEVVERQREKLQREKTREREDMMARFASATRQMLQRIDSLEKDVKEAQSEVAKHPSVFGIYDVIAPEPVKHSVSILVAKEKERDTFVEVATNLQKFAELVCRMESDASIDTTQIISDAKSVLKVSCT